MSFFNVTLSDLFFSWIVLIPQFIALKILTNDWRLHWKDLFYMVPASLFLAVFFQVAHNAIDALAYAGNFIVMLCFFLYFYKIAAKPLAVSFVLTILSLMIAIFVEITAHYPVMYFFPAFPDVLEPLPSAIYVLLVYAICITIALLLAKGLRKFFASIAEVGRLQSTLVLITAFLLFIFQVTATVQQILGYTTALFSWVTAFFLSYIVATFICFLFYARALKATQKMKEKEIEYRTLLYYMDECEHQQSAMQKFKHDQKNILSSLDLYIAEQDWAGLTQYYTSSIKPAFTAITTNEFALEGLVNIKVREIKSVLAAKLNMAQNLGIHVRFDVVNEIDHIPADSVSLVRMLGIILDNAIEELEELGTGTLSVACFKVKTSISFVVQNTCRPDIPPLRQLKQPGFSTKGKGRGIGLGNLSELVNALPNVALQTSIENGQFIQTIIIGGMA